MNYPHRSLWPIASMPRLPYMKTTIRLPKGDETVFTSQDIQQR
jgi:hypothetical protein